MTALERVIDWISTSNYHASHNATAKLRFDGTGEWLLETEQYLAWRTSSCAKLWVTGMRTFSFPSQWLPY